MYLSRIPMGDFTSLFSHACQGTNLNFQYPSASRSIGLFYHLVEYGQDIVIALTKEMLGKIRDQEITGESPRALIFFAPHDGAQVHRVTWIVGFSQNSMRLNEHHPVTQGIRGVIQLSGDAVETCHGNQTVRAKTARVNHRKHPSESWDKSQSRMYRR